MSIKRYSVISDPRTGSRSMVNKYIALTGNAYGGIHKARHVGSECLSLSQLQASDYTLHGHWYSLGEIDKDVIDYIAQNYHVVNILRPHLHRFLSSALVMYTKDINFEVENRLLPMEIVDKYFDVMQNSNANHKLLEVNEVLEFDNIFGQGASYTNYMRNYNNTTNANDIIEYYLHTYNRIGPC